MVLGMQQVTNSKESLTVYPLGLLHLPITATLPRNL